jgi:hypothetical protein
MAATLDGSAEPLLPDGVVRSRAGSGLPAAAGSASRRGSDRPARDKTIVVFDCGGTVRTPRLVADPELSPLDLTVAPNGRLVVSSEHPFGAPDAVSSIREYERLSGRLVRVFVPDSSLWFRRPRSRQSLCNGVGQLAPGLNQLVYLEVQRAKQRTHDRPVQLLALQ